MISVQNILRHDAWAGSEGELESGPFILRFRTPVASPGATHPYEHLLHVIWAYADEDSGTLPTDADSEAMQEFEDRLCEAWEHDALAILTAVLTFDGARQWVFYTQEVAECEERLNAMAQGDEPYPIELTTEPDPDWSYLRDDILGSTDYAEYQDAWEEELRRSGS